MIADCAVAERYLPWEIIENTCASSVAPDSGANCAMTERLRVPTGWLVRTTRFVREGGGTAAPGVTIRGGIGIGTGLTFLPDPTSTWHP
jgi:hypothetical protein